MRAPVDGVVETIHVAPNVAVAAGDLLVTFDGRELAARLEIARQQLAVTDAELRQARQQAVFDDRSRARIAILEGGASNMRPRPPSSRRRWGASA